MIKNVFYDLDGTLLPMDMEVFMRGYFTEIVKKFAPFGYDANELPKHILIGCKVMAQNDGTRTNEDVFWDYFINAMNIGIDEKDRFTQFYRNEFDEVRKYCGFNEKVPALISKVRELGLNQVLATNPLFPEIATRKRIGWAGLSPDDFMTFTTYEDTHYCKPNTGYYEEILDKLSLKAEETVMIGNDVEEDMVARNIGMKVFLVTDCMLNPKGRDISEFPHGDFDDALEYILSIAK